MAGCLVREKFTCIVCGRSGMTENEMKLHISAEHEENNICPFCDQIWENGSACEKHVHSEHGDLLDSYPSEFYDQSETSEAKTFMDHEGESLMNGHANVFESGDCVSYNDSEHLNCQTDCTSQTNSLERNHFDRNSSDKTEPYFPYSHHHFTSSSSSQNCTHDESGERSLEDSILNKNEPSLSADSRLSENETSYSADGRLSNYEPSSSADSRLGKDEPSSSAECAESGRPNLYLDVPQASGHIQEGGTRAAADPALNSYSCPFCNFSTHSEASIEQHVNRQHSDILSPMKLGAASNSEDFDVMYKCPLCGCSQDTPRSLEAHINASHTDILSPTKWSPAAPGTSQVGAEGGNGQMFVCPVCELQCHDASSLSRHVEGHFSAGQTPDRVLSDKQLAEEIQKQEVEAADREKRNFESLQAMYGMDEKTSYKDQYEKSLEKAVWKGDISIGEYHSQKATLQSNDLIGVDDGHSCTKDLISRLQKYHRYSPGYVEKAWLCTTVDHYSGSYGDKGWGCGYRNLQMLLSSLVHNPQYSKILFNDQPLIPSIPKIQQLIEMAWNKGIDRQGCEQLGGRVVNTRKWIGATEIVALLSAFKIKCKLVDFQNPTGKGGTHPKLFEWVKNYFEKEEDFKPPLYLQHQGHSRTVIGVEEMRDKSLRLLLFDPSSPKRQMEQFYGKVTGYLMRSLRRPLNGLRAKQYQIVAVVGVLSDREYEEYKFLKSEKIT